ncbi:MAG: glutamate racemase [Oscillospiraceae bacterium]|nr:glutamate racemase [Oscillospiraceae bacterium]
MDNRPIGVFDSGLGGLTAVSEIMKILPDEEIVYFGDTARVPYGTRGTDTIMRYVREDIDFLKSFDIKAVVMACGTASSVSLPFIQDEYDIPIIGVVRPAVEAAIRATNNEKIGIIGTSATIKSRSYEREILKKLPGSEIQTAACPLFVPLVENGRTDPDDIVLYTMVEEYLTPIKKSGVDTLIMGCTHYPIIERAIAKFMGDEVALINPGREAAKFLKESENTEKRVGKGKYSFFVSDDREGFIANASKFLGGRLSGEVSLAPMER